MCAAVGRDPSFPEPSFSRHKPSWQDQYPDGLSEAEAGPSWRPPSSSFLDLLGEWGTAQHAGQKGEG